MTLDTIRQVQDSPLRRARDTEAGLSEENDLRPLDDAAKAQLLDNGKMESVSCSGDHLPSDPHANERDPDVLRAALNRETGERRRAECLAKMQTDVVQLALDLLVREPDIDRFFGALTKEMVDEGDSRACGVWLIDEDRQRCELWMAYVVDRLYTRTSGDWDWPFPREAMGAHLYGYTPGWTETVEYGSHDPRLPEPVRDFNSRAGVHAIVIAPLVLGSRTLGWIALSSSRSSERWADWWRVLLIEAMARHAALALHQSRLSEQGRLEERRKTILEERNRLARDIHDNLAQGFAAILMQLQAAQREEGELPPAVAVKLETAVDLARTHMAEARRSVGTLRPNVGEGEDVGKALQRIADLAQRTTSASIELRLEELPRFGDGVEREILSIAQEALTNAVRHSRARRITMRASTVRSIGLRLSVADDGRGIAREHPSAGFGMTSMHERAERIGASLTIVTAPRSGTEVVLAWEPSSLPTQVHVAV
jgi:signal transduction histidine kinase